MSKFFDQSSSSESETESENEIAETDYANVEQGKYE